MNWIEIYCKEIGLEICDECEELVYLADNGCISYNELIEHEKENHL